MISSYISSFLLYEPLSYGEIQIFVIFYVIMSNRIGYFKVIQSYILQNLKVEKKSNLNLKL